MTNETKQKLINDFTKFLRDNNISVNEIEDYFDDNQDGLFNVTLEYKGGGEGDGAEIHKVFKVSYNANPKESVLLRVDGYYSSYDDTDWDEEFVEVEPVEVTVIQYLPIKK